MISVIPGEPTVPSMHNIETPLPLKTFVKRIGHSLCFTHYFVYISPNFGVNLKTHKK